MAVPKNFGLQGTVTSSSFDCGLEPSFIVILYLTLRQTFAITKAGSGFGGFYPSLPRERRSSLIRLKRSELLLIAETTNDMLDRLEKEHP